MPISGVSINIFGYNSEKIIGQTIKCLANQKFKEKINWEIILVDNNSTDKTCDVAIETWNILGFPCPFHLVKEKRQGSSYAHLKGIEVSKYDIMIFVDQDNLLDENYVDTAYHFMNDHPEIGISGGKSIGKFEKEPEPWLYKFQTMLAVGTQGKGIEDVTDDRKFVWGASSVIRRPVVLQALSLGFYLISPGRAGKKLLAGDDMELCYAVRALGYRIYYNEHLQFQHLIPASRLEWKYLKIIYRGYGNSTIWSDIYEWYLNNKYLDVNPFFQWLRHLTTFAKPILKYNILLFLYPLLPKGSDLSIKIEIEIGRINEFFTTSYQSYFQNTMCIRNFLLKSKKIKTDIAQS